MEGLRNHPALTDKGEEKMFWARKEPVEHGFYGSNVKKVKKEGEIISINNAEGHVNWGLYPCWIQ